MFGVLISVKFGLIVLLLVVENDSIDSLSVCSAKVCILIIFALSSSCLSVALLLLIYDGNDEYVVMKGLIDLKPHFNLNSNDSVFTGTFSSLLLCLPFAAIAVVALVPMGLT